jgi:hypothetical protein
MRAALCIVARASLAASLARRARWSIVLKHEVPRAAEILIPRPSSLINKHVRAVASLSHTRIIRIKRATSRPAHTYITYVPPSPHVLAITDAPSRVPGGGVPAWLGQRGDGGSMSSPSIQLLSSSKLRKSRPY